MSFLTLRDELIEGTGIYLYVLKGGTFTESRKMLLIK